MATDLARATLRDVTELHTERLLLRQWRDADLVPFAALNADPEVTRHFPAPLSRAESDALAGRARLELSERGWGLWALEVRGEDRFIGFVGLAEPSFESPFTPAIEVGWRLARPYWGHGYATEGARAALAFGFDELDLEEIVSFTSAINERSRKVTERLGMWRDPRRRLLASPPRTWPSPAARSLPPSPGVTVRGTFWKARLEPRRERNPVTGRLRRAPHPSCVASSRHRPTSHLLQAAEESCEDGRDR